MDEREDTFDPRKAAEHLKDTLLGMKNSGIAPGLTVTPSGNNSGWRYWISSGEPIKRGKSLFIQQKYGKKTTQ